jgi:CheY-like chemotaxis protein
MSRITSGKLELRQERIELAPIVQSALEVCRPLAQQAGHELSVSLPAEPIHLHADPARLAQVLGNLLNNACRYTPPGGRISLNAQQQGSEAVIKVQDTGIGIPPDKLDSVFEMFAQIDRPWERSHGGLGIGLTLAKQLIEIHGGSIAAHSQGQGLGSEFVIRLPLAADAPHAAPPKPAAQQRPAVTRRILIVDDNQDAAKSLAMLLKITGNQTQLAFDGLEAVKAAAAFRPEVLLLDIGLPKLSGYDVCRQIREQPWGKDLVIVALTGWGQEEDRRISKEAGFNYHMVKPLDYEALMRLLADPTDGAAIASY